MTDTLPTPAELMPRWWQIGAQTLLYAAYLLWLIPLVQYFANGASLGTALAWLAGVIVVQFILAKLVSLAETLATARALENLRAARDGDAPNFGEID
ncbi:hypothetical protein KDD17_05785 [Sulfitobacter albidus]|uniref:Uncharacterized protein n=1 Tax=Sulfitobacter albidus TaxID=2829501 RepID=A0A975JFV4_9RHOB|nr:hypothetical protein [Sulfitobacter albidus]QUJ77500.1 hypothetical protein KDD17_05785 [Sulfitobacter albidus]